MRLCRFGQDALGVVEGEAVRDVTAALDALPAYRYPLPTHDVLIANLDKVVPRIKAMLPGASSVPLSSVALLSPVANPGKLVAAPVNYQKHLDEVKVDSAIHANNPAHTITIQSAGLFLKATSSLIGPGGGISVCKPDRRTDHEVELAVVIGRQGRNISRGDALRYVAGYCIGLDVTIRGSEDRSFRKSPDSYSVLGPWLVTADEIPDPDNVAFTLRVNGEVRQDANTNDLIYGTRKLIAYASSFYTLHPGDVIYTGSPSGVAPVKPGDVMVADCPLIGRMEVKVRLHGA